MVVVIHDCCVYMAFFGMVSFIENQQVDLLHSYEGSIQAIFEDSRSTDHYFGFSKDVPPGLFRPHIAAHFSDKVFNWLI